MNATKLAQTANPFAGVKAEVPGVTLAHPIVTGEVLDEHGAAGAWDRVVAQLREQYDQALAVSGGAGRIHVVLTFEPA